jgi:hypothetical protein
MRLELPSWRSKRGPKLRVCELFDLPQKKLRSYSKKRGVFEPKGINSQTLRLPPHGVINVAFFRLLI